MGQWPLCPLVTPEGTIVYTPRYPGSLLDASFLNQQGLGRSCVPTASTNMGMRPCMRWEWLQACPLVLD